jgi:hypothetical protein
MIKEHIVKHIIKKLEASNSLVIYDDKNLYSDLLSTLSDKAKVVDLRKSVLDAREGAYEYFNNDILKKDSKGLIIYSPFEAPLDEQSKIEDPFYIFTLGKSYFPDGASDRFETLSKACYPQKEQEIDELFSHSIPDFETIDALGDGNTYAKLQVLTGGKSEKEILQVLMVPNNEQEEKLKSNKTWFTEYKKLVQLIGIKTTAKTFEQVNDELWRVMLFSEFVFDLPISLPKKLQAVPIVKESSKALVLDLVKNIRNNKASEQIYIEKANEIENQLALSTEFKNETSLGAIVTFAFEDNTYFNHFVDLLTKGDLNSADSLIKQNKENIWPQHDEERKNMWLLADFALKICQNTSVKNKYPKEAKDFVILYSTKLYEIDLYQRQFEMTLSQIISGNDGVNTISNYVRNTYRDFVGDIQKAFQESISQWPIEGIERNIQLYDKFIAPELKGKKKIAYILVDALRFEIGKDLEHTLSRHFTVQVTPSCAFVPTVTKFAMAALLPNAEKALSLEVNGGKLESFLDGEPALNLEARRKYFLSKLGDRCEIVSLDELLSNFQKTPDLLVVTTTEIDSAGENLNVTTALASMQQSLHNLLKGLVTLKKLGYEKAIIATDHGFMLYPNFQPGDNVKRPVGEWSLEKSRCVGGKGVNSENAISFTANAIGVNSSIEQFQFLKNFAVFEKNTQYFHEGISLQEAIVPIIEISINKTSVQSGIEITLTYKGKTEGEVTTRRPVIDLMCFQDGNMGLDPISIKIEAVAKGEIIGEPKGSEEVNSLTKLVEVYPSRAHKIPIALDDDFEGKFKIIASDPVSGKEFATLDLITNYLD